MFSHNYFNNKLATFKFSLLQKTIVYNFFGQINLSTTIGTILTSLFFSQSVLAESFRGYCIAQKKTENTDQQAEVVLLESQPSETIIVAKGGKKYTISIDEINKRQLVLQQEGETIESDRMTLTPEGGQIKSIVLGQDNWLWIDRNALDYIMKVNFSQKTASFDPPIRLPELSDRPCHLIRRLFKKCLPGEYNYSPSLNRVFISGYPKKSWGKQSYTHSEFISGEEKAVPEALEQAMFIADLPQWKGALFRNITGEALFYDGKTVVDLSQDFLKLNNSENFQDWDFKQTASGRSFIGKFAHRTDEDALFLMELTPQPGFKPVYLPEDFNSKWLELFSFPEDPRSTLWIMTRKVMLAEVDRRIQTVVALPTFSIIEKIKVDELQKLEEVNENMIPFTVTQEDSKVGIDYILRETSPNPSDCEVVLDLHQPIIFKEAD